VLRNLVKEEDRRVFAGLAPDEERGRRMYFLYYCTCNPRARKEKNDRWGIQPATPK
jgi:hypothetical protein